MLLVTACQQPERLPELVTILYHHCCCLWLHPWSVCCRYTAPAAPAPVTYSRPAGGVYVAAYSGFCETYASLYNGASGTNSAAGCVSLCTTYHQTWGVKGEFDFLYTYRYAWC